MNPRFNALGILERQLGQALYPMHRLDRAASGLLLYSRDRARNGELQKQFAAGEVKKTYFVITRGELKEPAVFDQPLKRESGDFATALTRATPCFAFSLPIPHPRGGERRFTAVKVEIDTGRFHQIRRHFAQAGLPLVGDSRHGDKKLNREVAALTGCNTLFLRCMYLEFHDRSENVKVNARWSKDWHRMFEHAGACPFTVSPSRERRKLS